MLDGLWHIRYTVAGKVFGGVLVIKDGEILGGDNGFIFTGTLRLQGKDVFGKLRLRQILKSVEPPVHGLTDYSLYLTGSFSKSGLDMVGRIQGISDIALRIHAARYFC
ncbi:GrlR family regulatory protein [Achromobacter sp. DH1f]|uniref:GrlR family regulatory protein n=1 Tax=Achromobacter sp. DH1f TaxID=1397275 RepID=UPI0009DCE800